MWTRELLPSLELTRTSLPAQVPDPGLLHRPARAPSSPPGDTREGSVCSAGLVQVVDGVLCVAADDFLTGRGHDWAGTSSIFLRFRHIPLWAGTPETELRFVLARLTRHVVRPFARLVGKLVVTCVEEETTGSTGCFWCEELCH